MANERDEVHPFEGRVDFPYWDGLGRDELLVQRCTGCARWSWPADWRCPRCGSYDLGWEPVEPRGVVYSWVRTHLAFVPAYAELVPYVNVLVELPGADGARLMGLFTGPEEGLEVGSVVTGTFQAPSARTLDLSVLTWSLEVAAA
ncbi:DNA-binding protein [Nocardioides mangrovicus]|uniref:DNA-binding protein n=1 Tax=Nocardioides mangrovicus TaxID=2478913 RepID=A0A3L8P148_9ACTN|nr:OB-fold domain-containing protein [Nocardioides mangrovicus]RLV48319.1 DNA-binding protein [Nocardioides mangrovicus]